MPRLLSRPRASLMCSSAPPSDSHSFVNSFLIQPQRFGYSSSPGGSDQIAYQALSAKRRSVRHSLTYVTGEFSYELWEMQASAKRPEREFPASLRFSSSLRDGASPSVRSSRRRATQ